MNDIRKLNIKELREMKKDLDKKVTIEKFNITNGKSSNTAALRSMKKDMARISGVMTEVTIIKNITE